MYKFFALISIIVRNIMLPNPFEVLGDGTTIFGVFLTPVILNIIAEPILHAIAFAEVGFFYQRVEMPAIGCLSYVLFYALNIVVLWIASWLGLRWYTNLIVFVLYVVGFVWFARSIDIWE